LLGNLFERPTPFACGNRLLLAKEPVAESFSDLQAFIRITQDLKQFVFQGGFNGRFDYVPKFFFAHSADGIRHLSPPMVGTIVPRLSAHLNLYNKTQHVAQGKEGLTPLAASLSPRQPAINFSIRRKISATPSACRARAPLGLPP
jgi:hypothetical protein